MSEEERSRNLKKIEEMEQKVAVRQAALEEAIQQKLMEASMTKAKNDERIKSAFSRQSELEEEKRKKLEEKREAHARRLRQFMEELQVKREEVRNKAEVCFISSYCCPY